MATRAERTIVPCPSGEQVEISFEDQHAVVIEVGGGLRAYSVDGREVLDGYGADEMRSSGRGQVLIPWPNRLEDGSYEFGGRRHQLPMNETGDGNAIHGLVGWAAWSVARAGAGPRRDAATCSTHSPAIRSRSTLRIEYALAESGLRVPTTATNIGSTPVRTERRASVSLTLGRRRSTRASCTCPPRPCSSSDDRGIPSGSSPSGGTEFDFRESRPVGATKLDNVLHGSRAGRRRSRPRHVTSPGHGPACHSGSTSAYPYLMLFTGDSRPTSIGAASRSSR